MSTGLEVLAYARGVPVLFKCSKCGEPVGVDWESVDSCPDGPLTDRHLAYGPDGTGYYDHYDENGNHLGTEAYPIPNVVECGWEPIFKSDTKGAGHGDA